MADPRTFADVRNTVLSAHKSSGPKEKVAFYSSWAESYEEDLAILDYRAPFLAAKCIASHFTGEKERAIILDVACGTGLVSGNLKKNGFCHFVGLDGSEKMLSMARKTGLYQELKQCMLCEDPFPVQDESYDVVVIVGALSIGNVPVEIIKELWQATKPGGYVCMTTRGNAENLEYKAELESAILAMEEEKKWRRVTVDVVDQWEKAVSDHECGYIPGVVYLYQKVF
ncbi:methyltransferase-like protein 27 [Tachysurus fulvidraco]|uniref:methyltransferase-like protein 27 n=1 Tax=Tachysurus fulvidraco TaxID=1234273 RepID=UPI001FEF2DBC|nr:methyltransferase-like protein 27 [Tachysurus fulvidraco]XP_027012913.2 methyltransferase-like protein 27 [Tachysurus fulvidraco]XP_027012923.2 methyltransferase-like protein 27 [Tachysurus fulvidraco]XP_027012934.2 methyltransferase-like protein 27 [Tachysurus fulvidraco]XP_027012945.2 methyltransferase-like protein 27 [Tachysurus fulvidraco]XP_027012955.2 methyltransferase-like protein 27 [Tachysurus fulvidraco]